MPTPTLPVNVLILDALATPPDGTYTRFLQADLVIVASPSRFEVVKDRGWPAAHVGPLDTLRDWIDDWKARLALERS